MTLGFGLLWGPLLLLVACGSADASEDVLNGLNGQGQQAAFDHGASRRRELQAGPIINNHFLQLQEVEVFGVRLQSSPPAAPPPVLVHPPSSTPPAPSVQPGRNLAVGRPAYSSSTYTSSNGTVYGSSFAVDGDKTTVRLPNGNFQLFQMGGPERYPWLSIDLGSPFRVTRVVLYNRLDCCGERLRNAEVRVGNTPITSDSDASSIRRNILVWKQNETITANTASNITVNIPVLGRWVTVQNFNSEPDNRFLNLQEVEVYGVAPPF